MTLNEVIAAAKDAGFDGVILEMIAHTYKLGAENEREACAVTAEEHFCGCGRGNCPEEDVRAHDIAQAIRARAQADGGEA